MDIGAYNADDPRTPVPDTPRKKALRWGTRLLLAGVSAGALWGAWELVNYKPVKDLRGNNTWGTRYFHTGEMKDEVRAQLRVEARYFPTKNFSDESQGRINVEFALAVENSFKTIAGDREATAIVTREQFFQLQNELCKAVAVNMPQLDTSVENRAGFINRCEFAIFADNPRALPSEKTASGKEELGRRARKEARDLVKQQAKDRRAP